MTYIGYFRGIELTASNSAHLENSNLELLLDDNLEELKLLDTPTIMDVGAGVGNIAIYIASQIPSANLVAIEPHLESFSLLTQNIAKHRMENSIYALRISVDEADSFQNIDAIIGSPPNWPYDPEDNTLLAHAKYAGADGLDVIKDLILTAQVVLKPGGFLAFVRVPRDGDSPAEWFDHTKWVNISVKDYVVKAYKK
jgi:release factor glutamine methyltransferase